MPGRKATAVASLFSSVSCSDLKTKREKCNFCGTTIAKNASRMRQHIENCKNCTDNIKMNYLRKVNPLLVASNLIVNWLTKNKVEQEQAGLQSLQPFNLVRANPVIVLVVPPLQVTEVSH